MSGKEFYNISQDEMEAVLLPMGFQRMKLDNTFEFVYGKLVRIGNHRLSLRIYSGINPSGSSKAAGKDAIRVRLFAMYKDKPVRVGTKRINCKRIKTWAKNLNSAIDRVLDSFRECPACGAPQREIKYGDRFFYGCITYPDTGCNGKNHTKKTVRQESAPQSVPKKPSKKNSYRIPADLISPEQQKVTDFFVDDSVNVIAESRAGGGKTSLLTHLASFRKEGESMMYLAFGKRNAVEGTKKLPRGVPSRTTHSFLGLNLRKQKIITGDPEFSKNLFIMNDIYPEMGSDIRKRIRSAVFVLIGLAKNSACLPDDKAAILKVMDGHPFDIEDKDKDLVVELTSEALEMSLPGKKYGHIHTFNDWLWFTVVLKVPLPQIDCVLADEVQDFNACQIDMLSRLAANNTRIIAVGDPYQAIYHFRGADSEAFFKLCDMLNTTKRGAETVLLPTNYRCSKAVIKYVLENTVVSDIVACEGAPEGLVDEYADYFEKLDSLQMELAS